MTILPLLNSAVKGDTSAVTIIEPTRSRRTSVSCHALTDEEMTDANLNRDRRAAVKIEKFPPSIAWDDFQNQRKFGAVR
jgi:hypothetical protein